MAAAAKFRPRNVTIGLLWAAKRKLGLDEDTFRDALEEATGERNIRWMDDAQLRACLKHFQDRGFKIVSGGGSGKAGSSPQARRALAKLQALWIAGYNLGVIRARHDKALFAFIKRQTGIEHPRFLIDAEAAYKAIEALKAMLHRDARVDWSGKSFTPGDRFAKQVLPQHAVLQAQYHKLEAAGLTGPAGEHGRLPGTGLAQWAARFTGKSGLRQYTNADWYTAMNAAGELIRKAAKRTAKGSAKT